MKSNYLIYFFLVPLFVTGCAAVRPVTDMAAGAGGGYIADKLSNGNPAITAAVEPETGKVVWHTTAYSVRGGSTISASEKCGLLTAKPVRWSSSALM